MLVVNLIPTYNERENIEKLLRELSEIAKKDRNNKYLTLIVDDNSPDGTGTIVIEYQKKNKSVYLLKGPKRGLGVAMTRGIKYAVKTLRADIVISNEADFAYNTNKIPFMVKKIQEGYDVVVASRHVPGGTSAGWTLSRKLNHWVANKLFATWVAGTNEVNDHNGAFRAIRVKGVLDNATLTKINVSGFGFFNYYIYKLSQVTNSFYEFPVTYHFRTRGESKVSFNTKYLRTYLQDVIEYIILCLKIRLDRLKSQ